MSFFAIKAGARHSATDLASIKIAKNAIEEAKRQLEGAHAATRSLTEPVPTESGQASKASLQRQIADPNFLASQLRNPDFVADAKKAGAFGLGRPATFNEQMMAIGGSRSVDEIRIDEINRSVDMSDLAAAARIALDSDANPR